MVLRAGAASYGSGMAKIAAQVVLITVTVVILAKDPKDKYICSKMIYTFRKQKLTLT